MKKYCLVFVIVCIPFISYAAMISKYDFTESTIPPANDTITTNHLDEGDATANSLSLFNDGSVKIADNQTLSSSGGTTVLTSGQGAVTFYINVSNYPAVGQYLILEVEDKMKIWLDYNGTNFDIDYQLKSSTGALFEKNTINHSRTFNKNGWYEISVGTCSGSCATNDRIGSSTQYGVSNWGGTIFSTTQKKIYLYNTTGFDYYIDKLIFYNESQPLIYGTPTITPTPTATFTKTPFAYATWTPSNTPTGTWYPPATATSEITETPPIIQTSIPQYTPVSTEDVGAVGSWWGEQVIRNLFVPSNAKIDEFKELPNQMRTRFPFSEYYKLQSVFLTPIAEFTLQQDVCLDFNLPVPYSFDVGTREMSITTVNTGCVEDFIGDTWATTIREIMKVFLWSGFFIFLALEIPKMLKGH